MSHQVEDDVLRAASGVSTLIIVNGKITGLEVRKGGEQVAENLVKDGLLARGNARACVGKTYTFTRRGQIAYWAIGEAAVLEADRKSGRAA